MRKNNVRTGKQVIKALSIGLSASMMLQPVAAMADELAPDAERVAVKLASEEEVKLLEKAELVEEAKIKEVELEGEGLLEEESGEIDTEAAFEDALGEIEEAAMTEGGAKTEAVFTVGTGIITEETKAEIAELAAKEDVEEAKEDVSTGNALVAEDIANMDAHIAEENAANEAANEAYENVKEAAEEVKGNLDKINAEGTTASEAEALANEAAEAAAKAAAEEAKLKEEEAKSLAAYEEAEADYEKAVKDAEDAVVAAEEAIANAMEDADEAVERAQAALDKANGYKAILDANEMWAKFAVGGAQFNYNLASANLKAANEKLGNARVNAYWAGVGATVTGWQLVNANNVLESAKKAEEIAEGKLNEKKAAIEKLEDDKKAADKELSDKFTALETARANKQISEKEFWDAWFALENAKAAVNKAYNDAMSAWRDFQGATEEDTKAKKNLDDVSGNFSGYSEYQMTIMNLEKELKAATTDEEKNGVVERMAVEAMKDRFKGEATKVDDSGIWQVGEKFYGYKKTENGIEIYEYSKKEAEKNVVGTKTGLTQAEIDALGLDKGDYKVTMTKNGSKAHYTVTYYDGHGKNYHKITVTDVEESDLWKYSGKQYYKATLTQAATKTTYDIDIYATVSTMTQAQVDKLEGKEGVDYKLVQTKAAVAAVEGKEATYEVYKEKKVTISQEKEEWAYYVDEEEFADSVEAGTAFVKANGNGKKYKVYIKSEWIPTGYGRGYFEYYYVYYKGNSEHYVNQYSDYLCYSVEKDEYVKDENTVKTVNESELRKYTNNGYKSEKKSDAVKAVKGQEAEYKVTIYNINRETGYELTDNEKDGFENGGYLADYEGKVEEAAKRVTASAEKLAKAQEDYKTLKADHDTKAETALAAGKTLDEKIAKLNRLQGEFDKLDREYKNLKAKYDAYYEGKTYYIPAGWGYVWEINDPSQYEKDLAKAEQAKNDAQKKVDQAAKEVREAEKAQEKAEKAHEEAVQKLAKATVDLNQAEWNQKAAAAYESSAMAALNNAKTAEAIAKAAADYAAKIQGKAQGALKEAKEARAALDTLMNQITVSPEELEAAKARLATALEDYKKIKDELLKATELKNQADKDLELAKAEVTRLTNLENESNEEEEEENTVQIAEALVPATATITPGRVTRATATVATAEVEEVEEEEVPEVVEIPEEETPEAEAPEEVVIPEEETPEVPSIPDEKGMSWWWILVVLVLGATGAELYRRHQVKKNAEKVSSDK